MKSGPAREYAGDAMSDERRPFHNPFAALAHLRGETPIDPPAPPEPPVVPVTARRGIPRAVVRMERAGRGGKEVTVVEHLGLPAEELVQWLKSLKSSLGCGGAVEADAIVLQGDQRKRVPALLSARGVKRVTVG
jgi:translation initiation factor 1